MIRRERGFTLIEVVVAFVLLTLVLSVGFEIFSTGMARAAELDARSQALGIAQSQLALAGADGVFQQGQAQGESEDRRFRWTTTVTPTDEGQDPNARVQPGWVLWRVDVSVDWTAGSGRSQQLALSTLELGQRTK